MFLQDSQSDISQTPRERTCVLHTAIHAAAGAHSAHWALLIAEGRSSDREQKLTARSLTFRKTLKSRLSELHFYYFSELKILSPDYSFNGLKKAELK
jgi:hypothetical protein